MKTHYLIVAIIIAVFSFGGCKTKEGFDFKVGLEPQNNSAVKPGDVNKASEVINKRLQYFLGIPRERIITEINENQILLSISQIDTGKIDLIKDMIIGYHKLEFWETYENKDIIGFLSEANNALRDQNAALKPPADTIKEENPLFGILIPRVTTQGEPLPSCMIGLVRGKDTSEVSRYLRMDQIKALFPHDLKFYWSMNPYRYDNTKSLYELHAIKVTTSDRQAPIDGSVIVSAKPVRGSSESGAKIGLSMDGEGARIWARITRENINRCIAVVYDGYVRSFPRVMGEISGGNTEITGDFTIEEATELCNILKSGELPFEFKIIEEQIIKRK